MDLDPTKWGGLELGLKICPVKTSSGDAPGCGLNFNCQSVLKLNRENQMIDCIYLHRIVQ